MEKKIMNSKNESDGNCCSSKVSTKGDLKVYLLLAMVGIILAVSIVQSFQIRELKAKAQTISSSVVAAASASGSLDMAGWTEDEKMMYEHHGTVPDRLKGKVSTSTAASGSGMVGGC